MVLTVASSQEITAVMTDRGQPSQAGAYALRRNHSGPKDDRAHLRSRTIARVADGAYADSAELGNSDAGMPGFASAPRCTRRSRVGLAPLPLQDERVFGDCELHCERRELNRNELIGAVWDGRFVSDDTLTRWVSAARRAIDGSGGSSGSSAR